MDNTGTASPTLIMLACRNLNDANGGWGYAGRKDWRLPAIKELASLSNYQVINPNLETTKFSVNSPNYYLSSNDTLSINANS